jgi:hypothetical protein
LVALACNLLPFASNFKNRFLYSGFGRFRDHCMVHMCKRKNQENGEAAPYV